MGDRDPAHDQGLTPDRGHLVQDSFIYMFTLGSGAKSFPPASHAKIGARTKVIRRRRRKKKLFYSCGNVLPPDPMEYKGVREFNGGGGGGMTLYWTKIPSRG